MAQYILNIIVIQHKKLINFSKPINQPLLHIT